MSERRLLSNLGILSPTSTSTQTRPFWWWVLGALFLALSFALASAVFRDVHVGAISMVGLVLWLELSWLTLWPLYFVTWCIGIAWRWLCQLESFGIFAYQDSLDHLKLHLTLLLWAIISWRMVPVLCYSDHEDCIMGRVLIFQTALRGIVVSSTLLLAKRIVIEVILIKATTRFLNHRRQELTKSKAIVELLLGAKPKKSLWQSIYEPALSQLVQGIFPVSSKLVGELIPDHDGKYLQGIGDKRSYQAVRDKILGSFHGSLTRDKIKNLLCQHIELIKEQRKYTHFLERVIEARDREATNKRIDDVTDEIMTYLGAKGKPVVRDEDLTWLIADAGIGLERARDGKKYNKEVVGHLDTVLTGLVLVGIALVFAAFFIKNLGNYLTPLWTTFTGISFALGGTVQEYLAACVFVFSQHPYDIGDRVELENYGKFIVDEIHLGYTRFHNVDNGRICQIRHSKLCKEKIENLSWSNVKYHKDTIDFGSDPLKATERLPGLLKVETARGIRINRYFNLSTRPVPLEGNSKMEKTYLDILYKPRFGAAYEVLLSECQQRLRDVLDDETSEEA